MKLETLVNAHYEELNSNDKAVLQQILMFQMEYQNLSCEQIAGACHISRATLLRLCRKIGLSSFSDLKYLLKENQMKNVREQTRDFHSVCENYHLLIDELTKIDFREVCERIAQAETIYIYGTGNEQKSLAEEFKRIFLSVGKCVIDVFDYGEAALIKEVFEPEDLFLIISLSGETKEGIRIIQMLKEQIHTLSLTRLANNTISSLCEHRLYVATQTLDQIQYDSYELVGVFYALLDLLFANYLEYTGRRRR